MLYALNFKCLSDDGQTYLPDMATTILACQPAVAEMLEPLGGYNRRRRRRRVKNYRREQTC